MASSGLQKVAGTLAAADGAAHIAFFAIFSWRTVTGSGFRIVQAVLALVALVGMTSGVIGWALMRASGRGKMRKIGTSAVALSTTLAAFLLMAASYGE
ncbi:MAG: hypothetical protein ABI551_17175 [Polyangiaceae bacterium]